MMPPHVLALLAIHVVIGSALLLLGLRLKRSFRWVLIIAGGAELAGVLLFAGLSLLGPR
ncbi:hypothetical protein [Terricaulis sp.]|uniref:hypothetical protein n=1 Tax=Terricaulis sp. TaxID=2768686 RepID=UPI0037840613